jgi:EAL domain-containing protein (putative c-di-GMP-specific phosphodiesterase class I)/CheY-like chemotaxis protein
MLVEHRPADGLAMTAPSILADAVVLVVDDQESNLVLFERILRRAGLGEVETLTDPRGVVARCVDRPPDLLLLDLHMPHVDGYGVLAGLQESMPDEVFLPVIVITADATSAARQRALDAGAKDFLTKPFDHVELVQRVRNLLEIGALYRAMRLHNLSLRAELEERTAQERRVAAERAQRRSRIEQLLRDGRLTMVFQPIANLASRETVGVEALARFDAEPRRPPNEWFADAADVGLGAELELAAVNIALSHLSRLPAPQYIAVNVSPDIVVLPQLHHALGQVPGDRVVVEVTEHNRVEQYAELCRAVNCLHDHGTRVAVDDAGAGYAGLKHLLEMRPDVIKLDLDLTRRIDVDPARRALARSLVAFAEEIGAVMVAEGIETADELATVHQLGVPLGQGYHLAVPGPL